MPELPEVEMYKRYFERHALGQTIARVRVHDPRILGSRDLNPLVGRSFREVRRHGKHLFASAVSLSEEKHSPRTRRRSLAISAVRDDISGAGALWLHIHFGMSGDLEYTCGELPRFTRLVIDFQNGAHLAYEDMRLFGVVDLTPSPEVYIHECQLGPDPLDPDFNLRAFRSLLRKRRGRIKALLMSQHVIAGIGNLYADEALFRSSIDPRRSADGLSDAEVKVLFTSVRGVLREAIAFKSRGGDYPARYLVRHREEGDRCPRCGGTIHRTIVAGRTTYSCARHQR